MTAYHDEDENELGSRTLSNQCTKCTSSDASASVGVKGLEARISMMARTIRQTLRDYGHATAESSLPECIAAGLEEAAATHPALRLYKLPVEFRVLAHGQWLHFEDEQIAQESADMHGVDYQGLYVRDGSPLADPAFSTVEAPQPQAGEAVAWRWHWKVASEDDGWTYRDTPPSGDQSHLVVEPLYAAPVPPQAVPAEVAGLEQPLVRPSLGGGKPGWEHINSLFLRNGINAYPIGLRDELVTILSWARYGAEACAALTSISAERDGLKAALAPFALVAEKDIGEDEADTDRFQPMRTPYNRAPLLTVGDFRRALTTNGGDHG